MIFSSSHTSLLIFSKPSFRDLTFFLIPFRSSLKVSRSVLLFSSLALYCLMLSLQASITFTMLIRSSTFSLLQLILISTLSSILESSSTKCPEVMETHSWLRPWFWTKATVILWTAVRMSFT